MCEANAYVLKEGAEKVVMESVDILRLENGAIYLESLFGEKLMLKGRLQEMNLVDHRIVLVEE